MLLHVSCFPFSLLPTHHLLYLIEVAPLSPQVLHPKLEGFLDSFHSFIPHNEYNGGLYGLCLSEVSNIYLFLFIMLITQVQCTICLIWLSAMASTQVSMFPFWPFNPLSTQYLVTLTKCQPDHAAPCVKPPSGFPPSLDWDPAPAWPGLCYPRTPCSAFLPFFAAHLLFGCSSIMLSSFPIPRASWLS